MKNKSSQRTLSVTRLLLGNRLALSQLLKIAETKPH